MLPRLTAELSILERERIAVGTGALSEERQKAIVNAWVQQADPDRKYARRQKKNVATPDVLRAMGLEVVNG
jgi:hypothetical protein